jgi:hypothetical protein
VPRATTSEPKELKRWVWKKSFLGFLARCVYKFRWAKIENIPDGAKLWRAIYADTQLKDDGTIKSSFFRDRDGVSCDLADFTTKKAAMRGSAPKPRPDYAGLVEFDAKTLRAHGREPAHDPTDNPLEGKDYAHTLFESPTESNRTKLCRLIEKEGFLVRPDLTKIFPPKPPVQPSGV